MKERVRKIRFGIRFKFSLIMIAGVVFTSALISLAIFKQQEKSVNDAIMKWGSSLLVSPHENTRVLLQEEHLFAALKRNRLDRDKRGLLIKQAGDARKEIEEYFSSIVQKEPGIDIAFLIRSDWNDIRKDWNRPDQAFYRYHNRKTGALFSYKSGRYDDNLRPYVYSHYMETIDLKPKINFTSLRYKDGEKEFIILSMPIFRNDPGAYREYLALKSGRLYSREDRKKRDRDGIRLTAVFLDRIVNLAKDFDYDLKISAERERKIIFAVITRDFQIMKLKPLERMELYKEYVGLIEEKSDKRRISLSAVKEIIGGLRKKYRFELKNTVKTPRDDDTDPGKEAYAAFKLYGVTPLPKQSLDELALISYRMDLAGMHGFFLTRGEFYSAIEANRREIIDLIMSILLRCVVIAIFFPTFLIRSIRHLSDAALDIGKGKLDTVVTVKGSDEIGRLADILNVMTRNLKKARDEIADKQRMEDELVTAQEIQEALLPKELPRIKGFEFGAFYSAQTESGGDYYDFIPLDDTSMGITVADVSGHGVGSGLVMAMTRTLLHTYCRNFPNLKQLMSAINDYLQANTADNYFVTMFYGVLDLKTLEMRFASAGHLPGIILRSGGLEELSAPGIALGAFDDSVFDEIAQVKSTKLKRGDYFIQYTDGIIEAMDGSRNEYGMERFYRVLTTQYGKKPKEMIDAVMTDIKQFIGKALQHDDITMIVIQIL